MKRPVDVGANRSARYTARDEAIRRIAATNLREMAAQLKASK